MIARKRHLWRWLLLIPAAGVAVLLYFVGLKLKPELELSSCSNNTLLTVAPTDLAPVDYLVPLGNIGPPDHTVPTDHIYYTFKRTDPSSLDSPIVELKSPGKIRITSLNRQTASINGKVRTDDYHIFWQSCRQVNASFDHIVKLSPRLEALANGASCQDTHPRPTDTYRYCEKDVDILLQPGESIGEVGGPGHPGFDIGATDSRQPALVYANPSRYGSKPDHTSCPIDLFAEPVKSQLMGLFKRTVPPVCGQVDQDKAGTLQGNWYSFKGGLGGVETWAKSLALVHDNFDPSQGIVSVGGLNGFVGRVQFTPQSSGDLNREFSQVIPGQTVYCYQIDHPSNGQPPVGVSQPPQENHSLLVQLVSDSELKIQVQNGACGPAPYSLSSPTSYYR